MMKCMKGTSFLWFSRKHTKWPRILWKKKLAFVWSFIWIFKQWKKLENGIIVPEWLFDIKEFWADPITQFQDKKIFDRVIEEQKNKKSDTSISWETLEFAYEDEAMKKLEEYLINILYSKSSIKTWIHEELEFLLNHFWLENIDFTKIVFKEIQAFISKYLWQTDEFDTLKRFIKTPTDLLRLFAITTNTDISLWKNIKFPRFRRAQRRFILDFLENAWDLSDDFYKYKNLWKTLWEYLHPWEYKNKYPKAFYYFDKIRNSKLETYNSKLEKAIKEKDIDKILKLVFQRPWIFARKLHEVLRIAWKDYKKVLDAFDEIWERLELKNLLVMKSYFDIYRSSKYRTVINKMWKIKVIENNTSKLLSGVDKKTASCIEQIIQKKVSEDSKIVEKNSEEKEVKTVFISEELKNITIPLSSRKSLDWYYTCGRGSRFGIDTQKTLRLFAYWKEESKRTDLDLSVILFDSEFATVWHVSYTNLKTDNIIHSWDIQSAPNWAVEYIDIDLWKMLSEKNSGFSNLKNKFFGSKKSSLKDAKYIAVQIYKYFGDNFEDIECFAWWQIRDKVDSDYKSFDEKTVENKFDLYWTGSYFMPIVLDLEKEQIVYTDLSIDEKIDQNNVEWSLDTVSIIASEVIRFNKTKPNIYDLAKYHAVAKDLKMVEDKEKADIIFDVKDWDYNIKNSEKILSELL